jgi:dipeptidyl aminopeptidase/acylaminoacyl peptidase
VLALLTFSLTVESIMRGPALVGQAPRGLRWSADSSLLRFTWAKPDGKGEPEFRDYQVKKDGSGLGPGTTPETEEDRIVRLDQTASGQVLTSQGGSLFLRDNSKTEARKLPIEDARQAIFIEDGKAIAFFRGGDIYRADITDGKTVQLSHLVIPTPLTTPAPETSEAEKSLTEANAKLFKAFSPSGTRSANSRGGGRGFGGLRGGGSGATGGIAITIPAGRRAGATSVSPSGKFAAVGVTEDGPAARVAEVPSYVTRSGYAEMLSTYAKVGGHGGRDNLLIVDLTSGATITYAPPRPGSLRGQKWSPDGQTLAVWVDSEDHKDAWLVAYDAATKSTKTLYTEHDDGWVGGPTHDYLQWTPEGRLVFGTENEGFANLWTMKPDGSDSHALVGGKFEVSDVTVDRARNRFVFVSSAGSPFKRHVDAVPFTGGPVTKLIDLSADEDAAYAVAPDGTLAVVRSSPARPAELWVEDKQITHTPTEEWLSYPWIEAPIVQIPSRDGTMVPAKLFKPKKWKKGGPAVLFVHGAGYLQNVYEGWSHYFREMMFNHLLLEKGYMVLDVDFRASAGYGKAWRTAIYRNMGGKDLEDNVDGAKWLTSTYGVDPKRIGLYGGSYGGFITLMAMFRAPDVFAAGAALRPVADWRNYHGGYTSPILNNPQDDPEAYQRSSPINFAEGLKGSLLICHGMVDTNVHFQDSVRLTERLIELGKKNWSLAPYPVEDHAFTRPESWTDEYSRILEMFDRTIGPGWKKK